MHFEQTLDSDTVSTYQFLQCSCSFVKARGQMSERSLITITIIVTCRSHNQF